MRSNEETAPPLELWGGVECTVNRVGEEYHDQCERNGHAARLDDLNRFAELGIRALRYPVLWERVAPEGPERPNWAWTDERLARLRELGIRPIVGLVHHGSGPRYTSLLDPGFPEKLAAYARAVAERYPWVEDWTPVNEPLTTARFSALYGHWYPHARDDRSFVRALLNQCRGVAMAMQSIRRVNPAARLVQTDDLGKIYSTPGLAYQADFENERRWLTWDLLCGLVDRYHPVYQYLHWACAGDEDLHWFLDNPCPPDVIGVNHYLTSERFIDERLERYPDHCHGGNGHTRYADVEAVRVLALGTPGPHGILREAWERYNRPVAVTEAHLGCTREEQMRWFASVWEAARELHRAGAEIRAVTAWALLGSYDWNSLLTRVDGHYEPGAFDLRGGAPRPTAIAGLLRDLAAGREPSHPVVAAPGWWERPQRILFPPVGPPLKTAAVAASGGYRCRGDARPLLITGATGTLGRAFARLCTLRGLPYRLLSRQEMDITDYLSVSAIIDAIRPWAVVNTAGYVRVDDAEADAHRCFRENTEGAAILATACAKRGTALLSFSSDLVFDGRSVDGARRIEPYTESDPVAPMNVYGRSKAQAEAWVRDILPSALIARTSAFFGPWDEYNFVTIALRELNAGRAFTAASDAVISPTYVPDLVNTCLDLLIDGEGGIWHLSNAGAMTWADLARYAAKRAGIVPAFLVERTTEELGLAARRPLYSAMDSERAVLLPPLEDAIERYLRERPVMPAVAPKRRVAARDRARPIEAADCPSRLQLSLSLPLESPLELPLDTP